MWISVIGQNILYTPTPKPESTPKLKESTPEPSPQIKRSTEPRTEKDKKEKDVKKRAATLLSRWQRGELSNFDYLMSLNAMAGRRRGDSQYHPILPWVIDFTSATGNWRDLKLTKYRINKGDQMLDFTFNSPQNPHHITEPLSETTYYIYLARRTSVPLLKQHVRSHYEPREYPLSIARMYEWTPDECIPEFYDDETVFKSVHEDMGDLELPTSWVTDPAEFIRLHRAALESGHVSRRLHHWIDLIFGYKLTGEAAIQSKNVMLVRDADRTMPSRYGFVQLFKDPHPQRFSSSMVPLPMSSPNRGRPMDLAFYENSVKFASKYFLRSQYHALPLMPDRAKNDQNEFYADDMFAMGCLLAELYNQQPLFNTRTLQHYLQHYDGANRFQLVPQLQSIPQPARSIVETLIDPKSNRGKKVLSLRDSKLLFPSYFKYAYWFLSTFYTLPTYGERYRFVVKHIDATQEPDEEEDEQTEKKTKKVEFKKGPDDMIDDKEDMGISVGTLISMPYEGLELVLPHVLQMFLRAQRRHHGQGADTDFRHITMWRYGLKVLKTIFKHNADDAQLYSKLRRCDTVKKIVRNKILDLYIEAERCSHSAKDPDDIELIESFNEQLLSYPFVSFVFQVVMSENEIVQKVRDKDRQKMFLEQVVPFLVEALFSEGPEKAQIAATTLCKLAQDDFGIILAMRHVIDPLLARVSRIVQSQLRVNQQQRQHRERNKLSVKALLNLGIALGPSTLLSHYVNKLLAVILESIKERIELLDTGAEEGGTDVVTDIFDMFEYLLHRLSEHQGHQVIVECIVSNNEATINELLSMFAKIEIHHFERLAKFICHLFLNLDNLELAVRALRAMSSSLEPLLGSKFSLDESMRSLNVVRGIADSPGYENIPTPDKQDTQEKKSSTLRMLVERIKGAVTNSPHPHPHHQHTQSFNPQRSRSVDTSPTNHRSVSVQLDYSSFVVPESEFVIAIERPTKAESPEPIVKEEEAFQTRSHFIKAASMYRELCCVMGNSAMREAITNSRLFEEHLSTQRTDTQSPTGQMPPPPPLTPKPIRTPSTPDTVPPLSMNKRPPLMSPLTPTTPTTYANKIHVEKEDVTHDAARLWFTNTKWNPEDDPSFRGKLVHEFTDGADGAIRCIDRIEEDERLFVTGGRDHTGQSCIKLWNMIEGRAARTIYPYGSNMKRDITKVRFLDRNRGKRVACCDTNNLYVIEAETAKPIFTLNSSGIGYYGVLAQSDFHTARNSEYMTFDHVHSDPNMLMVSTGDATVAWYDLRVNARDLPCYEWRLWMSENERRSDLIGSSTGQHSEDTSTPFHSNSTGVTIRSLASIHPLDKHIAVGLSTGVVFLLEKRTGLILDSFQAHERPIQKIVHYPSQAGHLFTIDTKSSAIRMWNTESAPARAGNFFPITNITFSPEIENISTSNRDYGTIQSFDVHCGEEADQLFAVTSQGTLLHSKSTRFVASSDKLVAKRDSKRTKKPSIMSRLKSITDSEFKGVESTIALEPVQLGEDDKFTDLNYLPLHKLLLATTSHGRVKLYQ
jgi:hypothetical protein